VDLQHVGDDGPERCRFCGKEAAGPCASCRAPVCGDCCTLTEGGTSVWAICLECDRKGGRNVAARWKGLAGTMIAIIVALALFAGLSLVLLRSPR
jgi:hypothetical protein